MFYHAGYSSSTYDSSKAAKFISILKDIFTNTVENGKRSKVCVFFYSLDFIRKFNQI